jgi:hypothetical protein
MTILICVVFALAISHSIAQESAEISTNAWTQNFDLAGCQFSTTGRNTYFILEPGYKLTLSGAEDGETVTLEITVLNDIIDIDGVQTRVVEERESADGQLVEVSRNFFAFCENYGSMFYFGEDVDIYEKGKVVSHGGAWRAGQDGFKPGLMMPGLVLIGSSYYQEMAPEVAMDRVRIVKIDETLETPAGRFTQCLVTEETTPIEPNSREHKIYAPGIGLIKDGSLLLVKYGMTESGQK